MVRPRRSTGVPSRAIAVAIATVLSALALWAADRNLSSHAAEKEFLKKSLLMAEKNVAVVVTDDDDDKNEVDDDTQPPSQQKQQIPVLSKDQQCSCWNNLAPARCCERKVLRAHKFGHKLLTSFYKDYSGSIDSLSLVLLVTEKELPAQGVDYRHVLSTRNWYDAMVSGYLYHRSGRECWLWPEGHKRDKLRNDPWDKEVSMRPNPPRRGRSICQYLDEENEEVGMRTYMDWALTRWYVGIVPYAQAAMARNQEQERTLFVCYEDLVDPQQQEGLYYQLTKFLFPSGIDLPMPVEPPESEYSGGHATEKDPILRARLSALAERLDADVFHGKVAAANALFGCGKDR